MNDKFIEGKWYKLRDDYPVTPNEYDVITFQGRETAWIPAKQPFLDKKPRKVRKVIHFGYIGSHSWMVIFEGIKREGWRYHPEDFDQMDTIKVYDLEEEVTILKKQVSHLTQILETQTIPDLIINNSNNC